MKRKTKKASEREKRLTDNHTRIEMFFQARNRKESYFFFFQGD